MSAVPKKRAKKPASAKGKGRRFQQKIMRRLCDLFPDLLVLDEDIRSTSMGKSGADLLMSPAAYRLIPFEFECKCVEDLNIWAALRQAWVRTHPRRHPIVVAGKNYTPPIAVIPLGWVINVKHGRHVVNERTTDKAQELHDKYAAVWEGASVVVHNNPRGLPWWPTIEAHKNVQYFLFDTPHATMAAVPFEVFEMLLLKRYSTTKEQ